MSSYLKIRLFIDQAIVLLKESNCYDFMKLTRLLRATIFYTERDK